MRLLKSLSRTDGVEAIRVACERTLQKLIKAEATDVIGAARSDLWVAHFAHYRKTHRLSGEQAAVLDDATRLAPQIIAGRGQGTAVEGLEAAAVAAFGESEARAVLRTLGPADTQGAAPRSDQSTQAVDCNSRCGTGTGSCDTVCYGSCNWTDYGCGPLWLAPCSGLCN
jgi:hypothetical protein